MAKFLSHDGVDANGVRAEVMVQTGTGRIKELVGRGKASPDGSFRNMEVVFQPDNPKLIRKVYALLDTTSKDLWETVQAAYADQRDISYRIESQRKRGVDRNKKFEDLVHTEEVVRVLAGIDTVFSHEAKTNPKEDPTGENPSALEQSFEASASTSSSVNVTPAVQGSALEALSRARQAEMPLSVIDTLAAMALMGGASPEEVMSVGFNAQVPSKVSSIVGRVAAMEEKPWMPYNSDGRVNAGSYMVAHAAHAEQFSIDHLIAIYSEGKKSPVDVSDAMIAQAASVALILLEAADEVQFKIAGRADRQKNSYNRALGLVLDAVGKRYPVPVGGNQEAQEAWRNLVIVEAAERLYGVTEIAQGRLPLSEAERHAEAPVEAPAVVVETPAEASPVAVKKTAVAKETPATVVEEVAVEADAAPAKAPAKTTRVKKAAGAEVAADILGAKPVAAPAVAVTPFVTEPFPTEGEEGFLAPSPETIARLRDLCVTAGVANDNTRVSNWLEKKLGVRGARKVHAPVLENFVTFYEKQGPDAVSAEV